VDKVVVSWFQTKKLAMPFGPFKAFVALIHLSKFVTSFINTI
jgi:hypothetical protein